MTNNSLYTKTAFNKFRNSLSAGKPFRFSALALGLALALSLAGLTGCSSDGAPSSAPAAAVPEADAVSSNTITVNSTEQVTVTPDIAEVVYAVRTQSGEAADCQQKNGEAVDQVIALLKELGVEESSIQTSDYHMNPVYDYSGNTARITGYEAVSALTVSDLPIEGLSDLLAGSVAKGVNTIESITYQASKYDESYQEALTKAVSSAQQKASALAQAAGSAVGPVVRIEEVSRYSEARYQANALSNRVNLTAAKEELAAADSAGEIMPGEIQVEAEIIVEYQLQ